MIVPVRPSRLRRALLLAGPPSCIVFILGAALTGGSVWPLVFLPPLAVPFVMLRREAGPCALDLGAPGWKVERPPGHWQQLRPLGRGRVSALAISLAVVDADGRPAVVRIWRDAVSDDDYRRLARRVRRSGSPAPPGAPVAHVQAQR